MNPGQFAGIGGGVVQGSDIPIGGIVQFSSSTPLEVRLPNGQVYLRAGELMPPTNSYGTQLPSYMVSNLGAATSYTQETFTGGALAAAVSFTNLGIVYHGSNAYAISQAQEAWKDALVLNANGDTVVSSSAGWGGQSQLPDPTIPSAIASNGSVGLVLGRRAASGNNRIVRNTNANLLTGWSASFTDTVASTGTSTLYLFGTLGLGAIAQSAQVRYFRSTDTGASWTASSLVLSSIAAAGSSGLLIARNPDTGTVIAVGKGSYGAVHRSTDSGLTYNDVLLPIPQAFSTNEDSVRYAGLAFGNGLFAVVTISGDVYTSADDGVTWRYSSRLPIARELLPTDYFGATDNFLQFRLGRFWVTTIIGEHPSGTPSGNRYRLLAMSSTDGITWVCGYARITGLLGGSLNGLTSITPNGVCFWLLRASADSPMPKTVIPLGSFINNAIPVNGSTYASGTYPYIRVA